MRIVVHLLAFLVVCAQVGSAEPSATKIGVLASLSGFAAPYGVAVREGAELAAEELHAAGHKLQLVVEDDQSDPSKVLSAYRSLKDVKGVQLLVGGSWWLRSVAPITERDGLPFLSCETLQDRDFIPAKTYFILSGRVADWVNIYEPVFQANGWRRGAVVKFTSGFSQTISEEMRRLFSARPREFVGEFEYQDLQFTEASSITLKLGRSNPDVVYVDGQPEGLANFLRRRAQLKLQSIPVVGHSAFDTALTQKLISLGEARNIYFLRRRAADAAFVERFQAKFKRAPVLNADLGYYAVHMAAQALATPDPLEALRKGMHVQGKDFAFDKDQVASGVVQEIYRVSDSGEVVRVNPG